MENYINIVLLGKAGSGKGTQAELLRKKYNLIHLSTGELIRENIKNNTELGEKAAFYVNNGELVPDNIVFNILFTEIRKVNFNNIGGIIFDGFPRTLQQAKLLNKAIFKIFKLHINYVIDLDLDDETSIKRIQKRIKLSAVNARTDDLDINSIKKRLDIYNKESAKIKKFYSNFSYTDLFIINANSTEKRVFGNISHLLNCHINNINIA